MIRSLLPAMVILCVTLPVRASEYTRRVEAVRSTRGLVAFWDFVLREESSSAPGRFLARLSKPGGAGYALDPINYVREFWNEGPQATYADFPLLDRGPFGQAVRFRAESDPTFRPTLLVPRHRLHGTGLDAGGPGRSVSMVVWMILESGNHAIAGIWHEGTDLSDRSAPATRVELGRRQYALFAGLAANPGAVAAHVSENGRSSFGDRYARHLAVTPRRLPTVSATTDSAVLDRAWSVVGFSFDNERNMVTAYLDGVAEEYWIENPDRHSFFRWPARGWRQASLRRHPELPQEDHDLQFPLDQLYEPPEDTPLSTEPVSETESERIVEIQYSFTRVRITERRDGKGQWRTVDRTLAALRVNPYWFPHDLYHPESEDDGGPFTIGRVIHSGRSNGISGWIGGVAVFDRALEASEMEQLAHIGRDREGGKLTLMSAGDIAP